MTRKRPDDVLQPPGESLELAPEDDNTHVPAGDEIHWSETHWFCFDQAGPNLSMTVYPVLRPNMNLSFLALYVWDGSAHEPWLIRYGKSYWHLPLPEMSLQELRLGDLELDCIEPLKTWDVRYQDGRQISVDLRWDGIVAPHIASKTKVGGHIDQTCRVTGEITLDGERYAIDTLGMRDKSWGPRSDLREGHPSEDGRTSNAYTYGIRSANEQFLVYSIGYGNVGEARPGGYLIRGGHKAALAKGSRRVLSRYNGYPEELELDLEDNEGRRLRVTGNCQNRLAKQAFPTTFAWLSMTEWRSANDGSRFVGEDQEVWAPYYSGPRLNQLNTRR